MTNLKNDVATKTIVGAKANIVKTMTIFKTVTNCCGVSGALRLKFTVGTVTSGAANKKDDKNNNKNKILKISPFQRCQDMDFSKFTLNFC